MKDTTQRDVLFTCWCESDQHLYCLYLLNHLHKSHSIARREYHTTYITSSLKRLLVFYKYTVWAVATIQACRSQKYKGWRRVFLGDGIWHFQRFCGASQTTLYVNRNKLLVPTFQYKQLEFLNFFHLPTRQNALNKYVTLTSEKIST